MTKDPELAAKEAASILSEVLNRHDVFWPKRSDHEPPEWVAKARVFFAERPEFFVESQGNELPYYETIKS